MQTPRVRAEAGWDIVAEGACLVIRTPSRGRDKISALLILRTLEWLKMTDGAHAIFQFYVAVKVR